MIDRSALLADLKALVTHLEADIRDAAHESATTTEHLRLEHDRAAIAERTAMSYEEWLGDEVTQAAVAWVLACVFVRFLEDNALVDEPLLSGPGPRRAAALGRREVYFAEHPADSDREYLRWCFGQVARFPAVASLYDPRHTPLGVLPPSVDGAARLRELWTRQFPETGGLVHDFTDAGLDTRFLGDLYQDLSEAAKKRYALLQTPDFVEAFILDRTLEPALAEFGLTETRLIDPTCGSGHFLISAFERLFARWQDAEPGTTAPVLAQRALDAVYGVDLNPFATAIARFRLVVAALRLCGIHRLAEAPAFQLHLATGDSLLHGRPERGELPTMVAYREGIRHFYETEDAQRLGEILGQGYHAVVGNPPYINVQDAALRDAYRARYESCHGKYALSVPFMERFFELADIDLDDDGPAGYVGKITANSFMKREFGTPLVERFLPKKDVTTIVDTSGAYIPGHATPTVVLFGRNRRPTSDQLRVLDAIRGEPRQPSDPAHGLVWSSIVELVDQPSTEDRYIRASDASRADFSEHPMTLGVGRDLRKTLERQSTLKRVTTDVGVVAMSQEDDAFLRRAGSWRTTVLPLLAAVAGDLVRDWSIAADEEALFPYEINDTVVDFDLVRAALWPFKTLLLARRTFGGATYLEAGRNWWEWHQTTLERLRTPLTITWGEVATHNNFVLDRGGKVFKQTAPVIKLPESATEDDHLRLIGVLNSSTACFWLKQVCQSKGNGGIGGGIGDEAWEPRYALNASNVQDLPLPPDRRSDLSRLIDALARERSELLDAFDDAALGEHVRQLAERDSELLATMISLQEELDWQLMAAYDLLPDDVLVVGAEAPPLRLGERAFEVVLARQVTRGEVETAWFDRSGGTAITALPAHWPADYRALVERRIELIEHGVNVGLIERPEHKRRWSGMDPFQERLRRRLIALVLDRLEETDVWAGEPRLRSVSELADVVRREPQLVEACALIAGDPDADVGAVVRTLVLDEAVPFLAAWRYTESGLRTRAVWERTWALQRAEDAASSDEERAAVGPIPVPPRYKPTDFRATTSWRLRGKLDVPKERFVVVPGAERGAGGAEVLGWAGWDEGTRARALAARVLELQTQEAAEAERLAPLLAGVLELLPWIHQWRPEPDPAYGQPLGGFFEDWLDGMLAQLGLTRDALRDWRAPAPTRGRRRATPASV
ncbi:MAG: hypothetical protein V7607_5875 [Solirubrobacteraceae bacterium]